MGCLVISAFNAKKIDFPMILLVRPSNPGVVGIDLIGPLKTTAVDHNYVLTGFACSEAVKRWWCV